MKDKTCLDYSSKSSHKLQNLCVMVLCWNVLCSKIMIMWGSSSSRPVSGFFCSSEYCSTSTREGSWSNCLFLSKDLIFLFPPFSTGTSLNQWHLNSSICRHCFPHPSCQQSLQERIYLQQRLLSLKQENVMQGRKRTEAVGTNWAWLFLPWGNQAPAQVTQRGCGVSMLENTQKPGHVPRQATVGDLAWAEEETRWALEVSSILNLFVTQWKILLQSKQ